MAERVEPEEGRGRTVRQLQRGDVDGVHGDVIMMHAVSRGRGRAEIAPQPGVAGELDRTVRELGSRVVPRPGGGRGVGLVAERLAGNAGGSGTLVAQRNDCWSRSPREIRLIARDWRLAMRTMVTTERAI